MYLSDICGSSSCLFSVPTSLPASKQVSERLHHKQITQRKPWGGGRSGESSLNFMHNLSSSKVSTTLKDNVTVRSEGQEDFKGCSRQTLNWRRGTGSEPQSTPRCNISQERSDHYDLQTSLQAVVTYNQLLAAQFAGVRDPLLVKACREGGARLRQTMRNWGKGQA